MSWPQARAIAKTGVHVRRAGWVGKWIIYWHGLPWRVSSTFSRIICGYNPGDPDPDFTRADYLATDYTTIPNALADCPPVVGACCVGDGCLSLTRAACEALGGFYYGDDTVCKEGICKTEPPKPPKPPEPLGACCIDGGCLDLTKKDCDAIGGFYQGDGSSCAKSKCDIPPPDYPPIVPPGPPCVVTVVCEVDYYLELLVHCDGTYDIVSAIACCDDPAGPCYGSPSCATSPTPAYSSITTAVSPSGCSCLGAPKTVICDSKAPLGAGSFNFTLTWP